MSPSRSRLPVLVPALLLALVLGAGSLGCSPASPDPTASTDPTSPTYPVQPSGSQTPAPPRWRTHRPLPPERIVGPYAASQLLDVALVRDGSSYDAVTSWSSTSPRHQGELALLVTDGDRSRAVRWTRARATRLLTSAPARDRSAEEALAPLLVAMASSLAPGVRGAVAGGDGATLLPFERVARSTGTGWQVFEVPQLAGGGSPFVSGQVVLPDGRLLVHLPAWTGDRLARGSRPAAFSPAHHGLWVSDGEDWSRWKPFTPTMAPGSSFDVEPGTGSAYSSLGASTRGDGAVWFVAQGMVFASPDGRVFGQVPLA